MMMMKKGKLPQMNGTGGKKIVIVPNPWGKEVEESYDFDVTNFLISFLRRDRLNYLSIMLYYLLISWRLRSYANFVTLLLILLMSVEFSGNIYRGLFSKGSLNLIHLGRWKLMIILSQEIKTWSMLSCSKERLRSWHQPSQEKLEQSIPRCKYRLINTEKLEGVMTNKRADMSRGNVKGWATRPRVTSWILLNKWQRQKEKD